MAAVEQVADTPQSGGITLQVYELTNPTINLPSIQKTHWKEVATIQTVLDDDDDDEVSYNGLLFFDGLGRIEGQKALTTLAQDLKSLHLLVSPEGYCFQDVSELGVYSDFGIHYLRLNDLFSWPRHGVELATTNVWSRVELKYHLPKHKNTSKPTVGGGVSKEKYSELEKSVKEKDEELEKLKEEMDNAIEAKKEELQKLKKANQEQQKQAQKIEELEKLLKEKSQELAKTRKVEGELKEAREKLSSSVAQAKKELEECQKKSWAINLPLIKLLPNRLDAYDNQFQLKRFVVILN
ncbi:hypothetical protein LINPERPRIM_LOCUS40202 [Linum perenne]